MRKLIAERVWRWAVDRLPETPDSELEGLDRIRARMLVALMEVSLWVM